MSLPYNKTTNLQIKITYQIKNIQCVLHIIIGAWHHNEKVNKSGQSSSTKTRYKVWDRKQQRI